MKYKYKILKSEYTRNLEEEMATLGEEGWELVCAIPSVKGIFSDSKELYFKKEE